MALLQQLQSARKPARVVTFGGKSPRGNPAVWKCESAHFQSLVEEDCQRVIDVASSVTSFETHPFVLELGTADAPFRYTPDLLIWFGDEGAVVEIKPASKLASAKVNARLKEQLRRLKRHGIDLCLLLDTDVRDGGLQEQLKILQRYRPVRGRHREGVDANAFDPLGLGSPSEELIVRWAEAQKVCSELLARVMRRDPGELLSVETA
jgi:hypothetical protein